MPAMTSRERMRAVLDYKETDRIPLLFHTFGFNAPGDLAWSNGFEQAKTWLSLDVDAWVTMTFRGFWPRGLVTRQWEESPAGERWPVMIKEYDTPAGVFRQEVRRTDDWTSAEWPLHKIGQPHIDLFDDYNVARYKRCPVRSEQDLEKLRHIMMGFPDETVSGLRHEAERTGREAREMGVLFAAFGADGIADAATWLCGVEPLIFMSMDNPPLFKGLLDLLEEYENRTLAVIMDTPVDLVLRRGYYEGTSLWSPSLYREHFMPRLKKAVDIVHDAGRHIAYTMSVGCMPLLDSFVETGYDAHFLLDPIPPGQPIDLAAVKVAFDKKIAVIGGLNEPITMEQGSPEQIRAEVHEAVRMLGSGGGLALSPAEAIVQSTPWESVLTVIDAWKEVRDLASTRGNA